MLNFFDMIGQLFGYILWFFFDLFDNYPLAVICFTVFIRLMMVPFDLKSRKASAKMARLSKKQTELQKRYKNNKEKRNEELAKLYQKEGANPLGGCLPQIFPILSFMGVYAAIANPLTNMFHISADKISQALKVLGESANRASQLLLIKKIPMDQNLLGIFSDSEVHAINDFNKGFNLFGMDLSTVPINSQFLNFAWVLPILCIATMIASVVISQKLNFMPAPQGAGCMKFFPYIMSIPFIWVVITAPSALGLYYTISNVLVIVQNFLITKYYNPHIITAKQEAKRIALRNLEESKINRI